MRVLVAGASGYVGSRLVPVLRERGHEVRATFSDPSGASRFWWAPDVEVVGMDVADQEQVRSAVEGVDAVYYLIHGMGGDDFVARDRAAAQTVARASREAGVQRIVYLSGLVPDVPEDQLSEHIASRLEVERVLTGSGVTTVTLRAAILVGAGSTSFEILRQVSERLPLQTLPTWMSSLVQPVAVTDMLEALAGALTVETGSRSYDVGGPDRLTYAELLRTYARVAGIERPQVPVPGVPSDVVGQLAGLVTDVPSSTVAALVESLRHDMVGADDDAARALLPAGHRMVGLEEAIRRALAPLPDVAAAEHLDPLGPLPHDPPWAGGSGGGVRSVAEGAAAVAAGGTAAAADAATRAADVVADLLDPGRREP